MLTQKEIDILKQSIDAGNQTYLYYVAHMIEPREGILDEHFFKSNTKFKVIKVELVDIQNAYFEYLNFKNHPENYHIETEESYYDYQSKYIHYYTVPNPEPSYDKEFTARMPSIIYGYRRKIKDRITHSEKDISDVSIISVDYTNSPSYEGYRTQDVKELVDSESNPLSWKYRKLDHPALVDDIEFNYITSDWYILDIKNFPSVEKPLINVNQYCSYFVNLVDAFNFIEQLKA